MDSFTFLCSERCIISRITERTLLVQCTSSETDFCQINHERSNQGRQVAHFNLRVFMVWGLD
jgi:hypothetical protein